VTSRGSVEGVAEPLTVWSPTRRFDDEARGKHLQRTGREALDEAARWFPRCENPGAEAAYEGLLPAGWGAR